MTTDRRRTFLCLLFRNTRKKIALFDDISRVSSPPLATTNASSERIEQTQLNFISYEYRSTFPLYHQIFNSLHIIVNHAQFPRSSGADDE